MSTAHAHAHVILCVLKNNDALFEYYKSSRQFYFGDVGTDLPFPEEVRMAPTVTEKVGLGIRLCVANARLTPETRHTLKLLSSYLYPRSSIYKTPLRQANCVGVIDPTYFGEMSVVLDNIKGYEHVIKPLDRLCQLIIPNLNTRDITFEVLKDEREFEERVSEVVRVALENDAIRYKSTIDTSTDTQNAIRNDSGFGSTSLSTEYTVI
jgi:dUTP pyrophosphatase